MTHKKQKTTISEIDGQQPSKRITKSLSLADVLVSTHVGALQEHPLLCLLHSCQPLHCIPLLSSRQNKPRRMRVSCTTVNGFKLGSPFKRLCYNSQQVFHCQVLPAMISSYKSSPSTHKEHMCKSVGQRVPQFCHLCPSSHHRRPNDAPTTCNDLGFDLCTALSVLSPLHFFTLAGQ